MKTFVFDNNYNLRATPDMVSWYFLPDSSLANAGKPFFIPDFSECFEAIPSMAVRISRLGKSVASKFSCRYYSEFAPAIHFRAKDLLRTLKDLRLPQDKAWSFDRSLILADFMTFQDMDEVEISMRKNGNDAASFSTARMALTIDETLSLASCANTIKMGDLLVPALPTGSEIAIGDLLELVVDGKTTLSVQIK